mgnify:CR=1 FL=1
MATKETDYWSKRINRIFDARERDMQTRKIYREAYTRMLSEVEEIYKAAEGREFTRTELYRFAKFLSFRRKAKSISGDIGRQLNKNMEQMLTRAYKDAGLAAKDALGKPSEWTVVNKKMAEACVEHKWAGSHFSSRIWTNRDLLAKTVENGVRDCILTGKSYTKLMHEINSRWGVSRRRTECLVRTELAHTLNTAQIETYKSEGVKYLDFDCEPTACGECRDIAAGNPHRIDKLPCVIRHPNCRCTWLPVEDDDPRLADNKKRLQNGSESGIMEIEEQSPRKKKEGAYAVDWTKIQSTEYSDKFLKIINNKAVAASIETRVKWALNNRDTANTEEMYAISLKTGEEIGRITDQHYEHGVKRTNDFTKALNEADELKDEILLIHNHPEGMPPSLSDINLLAESKHVSGVVAGHDGSIYYYTRPSKKISKEEYQDTYLRFRGYSEKTAQENTLKELSKKYGFKIKII